jgi:3-(3-hydroxy-phenyl)propionate hydroxylase
MAEEAEVVIAGAGPTGMMLAAELALGGVDVVVVEQRLEQEVEGPRSRGLHSRTIEVLDQRGVAERVLAEGEPLQVQAFAGIPLSISDFPTRHNYGLALAQRDFERILADWVDELGVSVVRGRAVSGGTQGGGGGDSDGGIEVELADGGRYRAQYLVGCDGGRSVVRKAAGIDFPGWDPSVSSLIAEVSMTEEPPWGVHYTENGTQAIGPLDGGLEGERRAGVVVTERFSGEYGAPTLEDLRRGLIAVWGTDFGAHSPTWLSRFTDMTRQAASYRAGRVLLAGDAAHVHYPVGGQGLNVGVQDAVNLGWKLAQVVKGSSPESLLDTYHDERHPVAARVLQNTMAQTALTRRDARIAAVCEVLAELLRLSEPRKSVAGMISGLDIRYDFGEGHPLLGRRLPDLEVRIAGRPTRVFTLLHGGQAVWLNFGGAGPGLARWGDRVQLVDAEYTGAWELPVIGEVPAPTAVLIRPDGHVAWVGEGGLAGLNEALELWFGSGN